MKPTKVLQQLQEQENLIDDVMTLSGKKKKMGPAIIDKLEEAFGLGCTDTEACLFADIPYHTLYAYQKKNPEFIERKKILKERQFLLARKSIIFGIQEDPELALKFMERKKKDEFSLKTELNHSGAVDLKHQIKKAEEMTNEELLEALAQKKIRRETE